MTTFSQADVILRLYEIVDPCGTATRVPLLIVEKGMVEHVEIASGDVVNPGKNCAKAKAWGIKAIQTGQAGTLCCFASANFANSRISRGFASNLRCESLATPLQNVRKCDQELAHRIAGRSAVGISISKRVRFKFSYLNF
jgi:hypothetical protein